MPRALETFYSAALTVGHTLQEDTPSRASLTARINLNRWARPPRQAFLPRGDGRITYLPLSATIGRVGAPVPQPRFGLELTSGNCLTQFQVKHRTRSDAPANPAGPMAPSPVSPSGRSVHSRGRVTLARAPGARTPGARSPPTVVQPLMLVPSQLARSREIHYLSLQPFRHRTPHPQPT